MALADFIQEEVARQASEDALRAKVQAHIDRSVDDAVKAAFGFGDVHKQIRDAINKSLELPSGLDVPSYGTMVLAVLREKMDEVLTPLVNERLAKEMEQILQTGAREVKLSALVDEMKGEVDSDNFGTRCTAIIEESTSPLTIGYQTIYLDPEEIDERGSSYGKRRKHEAAARVSVDPAGKIYALVMDQKDEKTTVRMGARFGWEKTLFALYATGGKLIVDVDNIDLSYGDF